MYLENALRLTAGIVLALVTTLGVLLNYVNIYFSLIYYFMALNLIQSSFTNWCPIVWLYKKLGIKEKC